MPRQGGAAAAAAAGAAAQGAPAGDWHDAVRLAFVQRLMREGCILQTDAVEMLEELTGSSASGAREVARGARHSTVVQSGADGGGCEKRSSQTVPAFTTDPPFDRDARAAEESLHDLVGAQSAAMSGLGLCVRTLRCPVDGRAYVGLVNTVCRLAPRRCAPAARRLSREPLAASASSLVELHTLSSSSVLG